MSDPAGTEPVRSKETDRMEQSGGKRLLGRPRPKGLTPAMAIFGAVLVISGIVRLVVGDHSTPAHPAPPTPAASTVSATPTAH